MLARHTHLNYSFWQSLLFYGRTQHQEIENRAFVEGIIDFMELEPYRKAVVGELAYGIRKRVENGQGPHLRPQAFIA